MSYDTHCSSCGMPYSDFAREGAKSCECHKMAAQAVRDFVFDKPALSASPVAQGNQLLTLLDDATVILQGLIEHPDDKDSWDDANKLLSKLLSRLERRGDECCAHGVELHQDCYRCDEGSPAPVAQEPVAYRWRFMTNAAWSKWIYLPLDDLEGFKNVAHKNLESGKTQLEPLYTSTPAPPAGVGAEPDHE